MEERERRKRARFRWLLFSWLAVIVLVAAGLAGIILGMQWLYRKNHTQASELPAQVQETSASVFTEETSLQMPVSETAESRTQEEAETESQLQTETQAETESLQYTESEPQTEIQAQTESQVQQASAGTAAPREVVIGGVKSERTRYVSLVMVGDNLMHYDVSMSGWQPDGTFNYDYNFAYVKDLVQAADIAIINQECVIGGDQWGIRDYPTFNVRTEVAAAIANAGFDVVLAANNHILDIGKVGTLYMIDFFRTNYPQLKLLGIHDSWETRDEIQVIERNGIRIGMINYTQLLNCMSDYNADGQYLVDMLDYDRLAALIRKTKAASDFLIVFPHWGTEYNLGTDEAQAQQVAFLAQQGVDLVIGTHPHVVEPVEYVDRPDGGKMLVYYSLGNFQSLQRKEATLIGGMAKVTIAMDYKGARIADFNMETVVTDYRLGGVRITDYFDIITTYPWSRYSRAIAESGNIGNGNESFNLDYMFQLQAQQQAQVQEARRKAGLE